MPSLARKNLFRDLPRLIVAQAGVVFAVSLVTIQLGIFRGFLQSSSLLIDNSTADIWVASRAMVNVELTLPIAYDRLRVARTVNGVQSAEPLIQRSVVWISPKHTINLVRLIGFDPHGAMFRPGTSTSADVARIERPYAFILDQSSLGALDLTQIGQKGLMGSLEAQLIGLTTRSQPIVSPPFVFTSLENANAYANSKPLSAGIAGASLRELIRKYYPQGGGPLPKVSQTPAPTPAPSPPRKLGKDDTISFILVRGQPGRDINLTKELLEFAMPETKAYTRQEMANITRSFWQKRTGVGFVLGLGALLGIIVGIVIVGQILYTSVSEHLREFGTLKAMGAPDILLYRVIVEQAILMAVLGYMPSILLSLWLASWTLANRGILILITAPTAALVFAVTILMCIVAGLFAMQRVTRVDPAIVFKA